MDQANNLVKILNESGLFNSELMKLTIKFIYSINIKTKEFLKIIKYKELGR